MQLFSSPAMLLIPAISGLGALAQPLEAREIAPITISHDANGTAIFPPVSSIDADNAKAAPSTKCIKITSDNPNWHYANTGVWGTKTGTFGSTGGQICVPRNDGPGGAMFIGTKPNPGAGNTKLEIKFPISAPAYGDVSLVDGYSLSVKCTSGSTVIGGDRNLWKTGKTCYDRSLLQYDICKNDRGYAATQHDVTLFFQRGVDDGQKFCIWKNCPSPGWPVNQDISCHVSGGR